MKKHWLFGIALIAIVLISCCWWFFRSHSTADKNASTQLVKPKALAHLPLTQLRQSGSAMIGRLESPMVINGYPCDANWVHFAESGQLKAFFLSDTCIIQSTQIPKGTWVQLNPDLTMRFCSFPVDTSIQGHLCDGSAGGAEGVTTAFYPSGRLSTFYAPNDVEIQGIPCSANPVNGISLYENGNLKKFTLSRDMAIKGHNLTAGQHVVLDEQGNVQSVANPPIYERPLGWITRLFAGN